MGPAPKPADQQRRKGRGLGSSAAMRLPSSGRAGDAPAWPISRANKAELAKWDRLWRSPQAVAWERLGWLDVVARYARQLVAAERRKPAAAVLAEVRQLEDRLGLSPMSMLRLRWEITDVDGEADATKVVDIRTRMDEVAD